MIKITYIFFRFMLFAAGALPFRILYIFSDLMYLLLFYIVGYRRKVVKANLGSSLPEKSAQEIHLITKKYYHHLCDIILESLKGFSMNPGEIVRRHYILNPELANYYFDKGLSVIAVPGHYNNWEWGAMSPSLQLKYPIVGFYKPMSNKHVDAYIRNNRAKFNTRLAALRDTASTFCELETLPHAYIMAADQCPSNHEECYWIDFLHHDTAWIHGPDKYARKYNMPVIYVDIQKVKRGFYELKLRVLTEDPDSLPGGEITKLYAQHLEKSILQEPAYWLWSHKRWKHVRN